jgi:hypothetical protein
MDFAFKLFALMDLQLRKIKKAHFSKASHSFVVFGCEWQESSPLLVLSVCCQG